MVNKKTSVIAIANHKGGCGKTTTVVHLASELVELGYKILIVDLDPQANASLHIGQKHPSEVNITSAELLSYEDNMLLEALEEETTFKDVSLIYGSLNLGKTEDLLKENSPRPNEELKYKLEPLNGIYDFILIDCPPSLKILTSNALSVAEYVIIPIESGSQYGLYGVTDLLYHIQKMKRINPQLKILGTLLIKHDRRQNVCKIIQDEAEKSIGYSFSTTIPLSTKVNQAAIFQQSLISLDSKSKIRLAFKKLAEEIIQKL